MAFLVEKELENAHKKEAVFSEHTGDRSG